MRKTLVIPVLALLTAVLCSCGNNFTELPKNSSWTWGVFRGSYLLYSPADNITQNDVLLQVVSRTPYDTVCSFIFHNVRLTGQSSPSKLRIDNITVRTVSTDNGPQSTFSCKGGFLSSDDKQLDDYPVSQFTSIVTEQGSLSANITCGAAAIEYFGTIVTE